MPGAAGRTEQTVGWAEQVLQSLIQRGKLNGANAKRHQCSPKSIRKVKSPAQFCDICVEYCPYPLCLRCQGFSMFKLFAQRHKGKQDRQIVFIVRFLSVAYGTQRFFDALDKLGVFRPPCSFALLPLLLKLHQVNRKDFIGVGCRKVCEYCVVLIQKR